MITQDTVISDESPIGKTAVLSFVYSSPAGMVVRVLSKANHLAFAPRVALLRQSNSSQFFDNGLHHRRTYSVSDQLDLVATAAMFETVCARESHRAP